jgi:hypothetical protein
MTLAQNTTGIYQFANDRSWALSFCTGARLGTAALGRDRSLAMPSARSLRTAVVRGTRLRRRSNSLLGRPAVVCGMSDQDEG